MERLGPFAPHPYLAVAVSGGADSMALALQTRDWLRPRGGRLLGLIVDHGLRASAAAEAEQTSGWLRDAGIEPRILTLTLTPGSALAARARVARYDALGGAADAAGITDILLGHHAGDQAETLAMRSLRGSGLWGLAGMAGITLRGRQRLLRPLLGTPAAALRRFLRARGQGWIEDPSNLDPCATRSRLRGFSDSAAAALGRAARAAARARAAGGKDAAAWLGAVAGIYPEGYALLPPGPWPPAALAMLVASLGAGRYAPAVEQCAALARRPRDATLAGVRIAPAGRLGAGWLLHREVAAMQPALPAVAGACWDRRFLLRELPSERPGLTFGALGEDAQKFRKNSDLPSIIGQSLPALRDHDRVVAAPHIGVSDCWADIAFVPSHPLALTGFELSGTE
jgi:tRNA(Ile)-lysidine synthase